MVQQMAATEKEATGEALFVSESLGKNFGETEILTGGRDDWPVGKCDRRSSGRKGLPDPPGHHRERCQERRASLQARECEEVSRRALREKDETISARNRELEEAIRSDCKEEHEIQQRMAALDVARWRRSPLMAAGTWATQMCSRVLTDSHRRPKSLAVVPTTCSMAMSPPQTLILSFIAQY